MDPVVAVGVFGGAGDVGAGVDSGDWGGADGGAQVVVRVATE